MTLPKLGQELRCKVTGLTGIATAHVRYLNGCEQICIQPRAGSDSKVPDFRYVDIGQLEYVADGISVDPRDTGGPQANVPGGQYRG